MKTEPRLWAPRRIGGYKEHRIFPENPICSPVVIPINLFQMKFSTVIYCAIAASAVSATPVEARAESSHANMQYDGNTLDVLGRGLGTVLNYVIKDVAQIGQDAGVEVSQVLRDVIHDVTGGNKRSLEEFDQHVKSLETREAHDIHHSLMALISDVVGAVQGIATETGASLGDAATSGSIMGVLNGIGI